MKMNTQFICTLNRCELPPHVRAIRCGAGYFIIYLAGF